MAEQTMTADQQKFMKDTAKKLLDCLVKIAPIPQAAKQGYQVGRETIKALDMAQRTVETGSLSASDDNMNRLAVIAQRLSNEFSELNRHDENWWIETSGANLFSKRDSAEALKKLQQQRQKLMDLKDLCDGLKTLAGLLFAQSVSNVKGLAKLYVPSIPLIDGYVTKDTRATFDVCVHLIDSIVTKVDVAVHATADMNNALDRFLALMNTQDRRKAVTAMHASQKASSVRQP